LAAVAGAEVVAFVAAVVYFSSCEGHSLNCNAFVFVKITSKVVHAEGACSF